MSEPEYEIRGFKPWHSELMESLKEIKVEQSGNNINCIFLFRSKNHVWGGSSTIKPNLLTTNNVKWGTFKLTCQQFKIEELSDPLSVNDVATQTESIEPQLSSAKTCTSIDNIESQPSSLKTYVSKDDLAPQPSCSKTCISMNNYESQQSSAKAWTSINFDLRPSFNIEENGQISNSNANDFFEASTSTATPRFDHYPCLNQSIETFTSNAVSQYYDYSDSKETVEASTSNATAKYSTLWKHLSHAAGTTHVTLGFLGLDSMGSAIVQNLLKCGHRVIICSKDKAEYKKFKNLGAKLVKTITDVVKRANLIFSCVSCANFARKSFFQYIIHEININKVYVELTSIDAETSLLISNAVTSKGGRYLESRILGTEEASLILLCAGRRSAYNDCQVFIEAFARYSLFLGEDVIEVSKMNLALQIIQATSLTDLAKAITLADKQGLNFKDVQSVLSMVNFNIPYFEKNEESIINSRWYETEQTLSNMRKNLYFILHMTSMANSVAPSDSMLN